MSIGHWQVSWYGLMYLLSFGVAGSVFSRLQHFRHVLLTSEERLEFFTYGLAGALLGGRLGYVILYEPIYFLGSPWEIFSIGDGGMASHGGFVGIAVAVWLSSRRLEVSYLSLLDLVAVPAALGLMLGRVGNIINQELFVSTLAQYFAVGKNLVIALICYMILVRWKAKSGVVIGIFLLLYGSLRMIDEMLRIQLFEGPLGLTWGQVYTIPLIFVGIFLLIRSGKPA